MMGVGGVPPVPPPPVRPPTGERRTDRCHYPKGSPVAPPITPHERPRRVHCLLMPSQRNTGHAEGGVKMEDDEEKNQKILIVGRSEKKKKM